MGAQSIAGCVDRLEDGSQNWPLYEQQRFQCWFGLFGAMNEAWAIATLELVGADQEVDIILLQPLKTVLFCGGGSNQVPKVLKPAHPTGQQDAIATGNRCATTAQKTVSLLAARLKFGDLGGEIHAILKLSSCWLW